MMKLVLYFAIIFVSIFFVRSDCPAGNAKRKLVVDFVDNIERTCTNKGLLIVLGNNGTTLKFEYETNDALLKTLNSMRKGMQEFMRIVFWQFFPAMTEESSGEGSDSNMLSVIKESVRRGEVVSMKFADQVFLQTTKDQSSAGKKSVTCGYVNRVRLELDPELEVDARDDVDMTALHWAVFFGDACLTEQLIADGADVNAVGIMGLTPLHMAAGVAPLDIVRLLIHSGADANAKECGIKPIHMASVVGRPEVVGVLAEGGADLDAGYGERGVTALHVAAREGNLEVVQELTDHSADLYSKLKDKGTTALHEAAKRGHVSVVLHLLNRNMDVDVRDSTGRTPLMLAADRTSGGERILATVKLLLESGADLSAKDNDGNTATSLSENYKELHNILEKYLR